MPVSTPLRISSQGRVSADRHRKIDPLAWLPMGPKKRLSDIVILSGMAINIVVILLILYFYVI